MALRRTSILKRDEIVNGWKRLYNEEFHNLYSSPDIIIIIKSRKMRWTGLVARMEEGGV
jgi:hypothetical protein